MKLENQVVSLELSKRLRELGVKQESIFYWCDVSESYHEVRWEVILNPKIAVKDHVSAFTVAELGEIFWDTFEKYGWNLIYIAYGEVFNFKGTQNIGNLGVVNLMRNPDMSAKMLIYLLENKLINL